MNRKILICAVGVGLLAVACSEVYACSPPPPPPADPIARINGSAGPVTIYACKDSTFIFDGSASSDPDGGSITNYKWEFPAGADEVAAHECSCDGCGAKCLEGPTCKEVECIFTSTGDHVVKLTVTDDDDPAGTGTCQATVKVVALNLTAHKRNGAVVSDADEDSPGPGAYLANNSYDDDDADGVVDEDDDDVRVGGVTKENDMIKVRFEFDGFSGLSAGKVVIRRTIRVRLWRYDYKGTEIEFSYVGDGYYEKIYNLSVPAEKTAFQDEIENKDLWLEGCSPYLSTLLNEYRTQDDDTVCSDSVKLRIFSVYFQIFKRDKTSKVAIDKLLDPGAYLTYNNDDDDADGGGATADKDDNDIRQGDTPKEDDMIQIDFLFDTWFYYYLNTGYVVIKRDNTKLKLWKEEYKGGVSEEVVFDSAANTEKVYDLSDADERSEFRGEIWREETYLWLEGYQASGGLKDTGLTLIYRDADNVDVCVYPVKITVFENSLTVYKRDGSTPVKMDKEAEPGVYVADNNDDDDADGLGITADKDDDDVCDGVTPKEDDTIKAHTAFGTIFCGLGSGKVVLKRENTKIKLWKEKHKGGASQEIIFDAAENTEKVYDLSVPAEQTAFMSDICNKDLWVEGYEASGALKDTGLSLFYRDADDKDICVDPVKITSFDTELKTYKYDDTELKMDDEEKPGNYILYNNDDDDGDDTKDIGNTTEVANEDDLQKVRFRFGSIFNNLQTGKVIIERSNSRLKLWKEQTKVPSSEIVFTANKKTYNLSNESDRADFGNDIRNKYLYVEGFEKSSAIRDTEFTLRFADPDDKDVCKDPVAYTIVKIDLDVNADGDTDDAVDEIVGYYPGYEGAARKISAGPPFGPQEMKIIAEPVDGSEIDSVELAIQDWTNEIGFCMNAGTQPQVDYSFDGTGNNALEAATIAGGKATQAFWCKDYGGFCRVKVELKYSVNVRFLCTRSIPIDTNGNRIADCWADDDYVNTDEDWDEEDTPNPSGTDGDGLARYEEYRGFMMLGTHYRTQARRKDLFVYRENPAYGVADMATIADIRLVTEDEMNGAYHDNQNGGLGSVRTVVGPRIVNFNYGGFGHSVEQHGLWMAVSSDPADNVGGIGSWGICLDNNGGGAGAIGSPETAGRVIIRAQNITECCDAESGNEFSYDASARTGEFIDDTTGHEGGHGFSVEHHGNLPNIAVTDYPGDWLNCDVKASYNHTRPHEAGSVTCVIRYNFFDISAAVAGDLDKNGNPESPTDADWSPTVAVCTGYCNPCLAQIDIDDN